MQIVPEPFELRVTVGREHYLRSNLISTLETITVSNNPVALAIREAADEKCICYEEIYAVIDSNGLGVYFKFYQIFNGEIWLLQANCDQFTEIFSLSTALHNQEIFSIKLNFRLIGCCNFKSPSLESKILWRPLLIEVSKIFAISSVAQVLNIAFQEIASTFVTTIVIIMFTLWAFTLLSKMSSGIFID